MRSSHSTHIFVVLAAVVTVMALAPPSHAAGTLTPCTVDGVVKLTPPAPLVSGAGTYSFDNIGLVFTCLITTTSNGSGVVRFSAASSGTYSMPACGTGTLSSASTQITGVTVLAGTPGNTLNPWGFQRQIPAYEVVFAGNWGLMTFGGGLDGAGPVHVSDPTPTEYLPTSGRCTSDLQVHGSVAVRL